MLRSQPRFHLFQQLLSKRRVSQAPPAPQLPVVGARFIAAPCFQRLLQSSPPRRAALGNDFEPVTFLIRINTGLTRTTEFSGMVGSVESRTSLHHMKAGKPSSEDWKTGTGLGNETQGGFRIGGVLCYSGLASFSCPRPFLRFHKLNIKDDK